MLLVVSRRTRNLAVGNVKKDLEPCCQWYQEGSETLLLVVSRRIRNLDVGSVKKDLKLYCAQPKWA